MFGFNDDWDEGEDQWEDEYDDIDETCECGDHAGAECAACGMPMCHACFEMSGGICDCH